MLWEHTIPCRIFEPWSDIFIERTDLVIAVNSSWEPKRLLVSRSTHTSLYAILKSQNKRCAQINRNLGPVRDWFGSTVLLFRWHWLRSVCVIFTSEMSVALLLEADAHLSRQRYLSWWWWDPQFLRDLIPAIDTVQVWIAIFSRFIALFRTFLNANEVL